MPVIPRIFAGQTVAIVAGGPSLVGFDFSRLEGAPSIAINLAMDVMPFATVLWWTDALFYRRPGISERILAHRAPYKATAHLGYGSQEPDPSIHVYHFTGVDGFDDDPGRLRHGNNGGYAAMHLAAHLGARRLVLFGFDMRVGADGRSHFHGGHGLPYHEHTLKSLMLPYFKALASPLAERGVEVYNASPDSALTLWPRCSIDEGVAMVQRQ